MGRVGLDQHTSTIFNPRLNLKKHPFGTVQSLNHLQPKAQPKKTSFRYRTILKQMLEKGTLTIDKN